MVARVITPRYGRLMTKANAVRKPGRPECEPGLFLSEIAPGASYRCGDYRIKRSAAGELSVARRAIGAARSEDTVRLDQEPRTVGDAVLVAWGSSEFRSGDHSFFQIVRGEVLHEGKPVTLRSMLEYPVDSELWDWLRGHGYGRPNPSGPGGTRGRANKDRPRKVYSFALSDETNAIVDALAPDYRSRSAVVEAAIRLLAKAK